MSIKELYGTGLNWKEKRGMKKKETAWMKRKQLLYTEERKWEYGTILIEDGICLIENGEGDILLAAA